MNSHTSLLANTPNNAWAQLVPARFSPWTGSSTGYLSYKFPPCFEVDVACSVIKDSQEDMKSLIRGQFLLHFHSLFRTIHESGGRKAATCCCDDRKR